MKPIHGLAGALAMAVILIHPASSRAAVSVTLECMADPAHGTDTPGVHTLYDVDYAAATVRHHEVNDDGAPATINGLPYDDRTHPAQITDREIKWSEQMAVGPFYYTLGRYSAQLQEDMTTPRGGTNTLRLACRPWTPTHQARQF